MYKTSYEGTLGVNWCSGLFISESESENESDSESEGENERENESEEVLPPWCSHADWDHIAPYLVQYGLKEE